MENKIDQLKTKIKHLFNFNRQYNTIRWINIDYKEPNSPMKDMQYIH